MAEPPKERRRKRRRRRPDSSSRSPARRRGEFLEEPAVAPLPLAASASGVGRGIRAAAVAPAAIEGHLQGLIVDAPQSFLEWLQGLGVQTCADVRGMWPGGASMVAEYEDHVGQRLRADEALKLATVWTLSLTYATVATQAVVADLVDQRTSTVRGRPLMALPEKSPSMLTEGARQILSTGLATGTITTVAQAVNDPHAKEQIRKQAKIQELFQFVLEYLVDLEELGTDWDTIQDPVKLQALKTTLMQGAQRLGVERLGALLAAARRWRRFALERGFSVRVPSPLQLAEFFQAVSSGGPTAAASVYQAMKWFTNTFGCRFVVDHFLIKPYKMHGQTHTGSQAVELQPWEFLNLALLARRAAGTKLILISFMLQSALSCIRFEHMQRSSYMSTVNGCMHFRCSQGKARRQGARPAYYWALPEFEFQGISLHQILKDFFLHESLPGVGFLWPAIQLSAEDLWQIHDCSPFIPGKKLSRGRFLELLRGTLVESGLDKSEAGTAGYNRLRRFLPTLGNCLNYAPEELQAIGSWVEIPGHGGPNPQRSVRATVSMGLHYAGHKVDRSGRVKQHALRCFMQLARRRLTELPLAAGGLLPANSWSWEEFAAVAARTTFDRIEEEPIDTADEELPGLDAPADQPAAAAVPEAVGERSDGESSCDTSSSASDVSAIGEDLVGIVPPEEINESLKWFQQGRKVHLTRAEDDSRYRPWCRDLPFAQDPVRSGVGFFTMEKNKVCQRCLSRMPRALYVALSEHCGWIH